MHSKLQSCEKTSDTALHRLAVFAYCLHRRAVYQKFFHATVFSLAITFSALVSGCVATEKAQATEAKQQPVMAQAKPVVPNEIAVPAMPAVDISHRYQYKVRGKRYKVFKYADNFQEIGMASWYGPGFHGKKTANGEIYNMHAMTAAHKTLPLGTRVRVTHLANGKKITVRINDRGPFHGGRIIDLSKTAARRLGMLKQGAAKVHVRIIE